MYGYVTTNKINDLRDYLRRLKTAHPNFAPALAATALYEAVFCGRMYVARRELVTLHAAYERNPQHYSVTFKRALSFTIAFLDEAFEFNLQMDVERASGSGMRTPKRSVTLGRKAICHCWSCLQ